MPASRFILIVLLGLAACQAAWGQARQPAAKPLPPEGVKASYLIYFGQYITWPADAVPNPKQTFEIGILGRDPFGAHLNVFAGHEVAGRKIVIRQFDTMKQYAPCHLVFISGDDTPGQPQTAEARLRDALARLAKTPVLIVTETPGFARQGAVINFVDDAPRQQIRMEINRTAEEQASLTISVSLLKLRVVDEIR
jgi:hypothetical protein